MRAYGLVGRSLSHSFSKKYFEEKFAKEALSDCVFRNYELPEIDALPGVISADASLRGLSVTIPYKESVLPLLHALSEDAQKIGAVNCIAVRAGRMYGYNTDVTGFLQSIRPFLDKNHERALVFGTGGASKAVAYGLKKLNIPVALVSRTVAGAADNVFGYDKVSSEMIATCKLIVNCTPVGMYPLVNESLGIPLDAVTAEHLVVDLIYNPARTRLLTAAAEKGATVLNGLDMLRFQADAAWEIWNS